MKKLSEIFSKEELDYLSKYKPDLAPMDVPSRDDLSLLDQPSLDQIDIEFLKQYEVNVEPSNVGAWNGWDTLATLGMLFSREGSTSNIASTIFASNRSNQINGAAQDWGTWKRWALDHKNFEQYKVEVIKAIELHNNQIIDECDKQIKKAELINKKISEEFKKPGAKEYIAKAIKISKEKEDKRNTTLGCLILCMPFVIIFFIVIDQLGGGPEKREKNKIETLVYDAKQLVDTASNNRYRARSEYQRIIEGLPAESYSNDDLLFLVFYNYFINEVNIRIGMVGQFGPKKWCQPQLIFDNAVESRKIKKTPLIQNILLDESHWIKEIGKMCLATQSGSYPGIPSRLNLFEN